MANEGPRVQTIAVIGGGIAGITAAVEVAETGYDVVLLEKGPALGGRVGRLNRYFPKLCHPTCGLEINYQRIAKNPRLKVMTMAEVETVSGRAGDYTVRVKRAPRHVNAKCTACSACAEVAESEVRNDFNYGLDKVKAAGLELFTWTVNSPDVASRLAKLGINGITTDRPAWLRRELSK